MPSSPSVSVISIPHLPPNFTDKEKPFSYVVDLESNRELVPYDTRVKEYQYPKNNAPELSSIPIPTIDSTQVE